MADGVIQLPGDSTGKMIDTSDLAVGANPSVHRERHVVADPTAATGLAAVTSSGGLSVQVTNPSTAVTVTNPSTAVNVANSPTVVAASSGYLTRNLSSGIVTLSSVPTVTATAATNPWSSAPGFNIPLVSASSGFIQVSGGTFLSSGTVTLSSNPTVISASSGLVQISGGTFLTSGTVTLSSNLTVISASSGLVQISGTPTVTATAATNPWSSAPGFNVPVVTVSSGLIGAFLLTSGAAAYPVSSSYGLVIQDTASRSTGRLIVATTVSKISSAPGILYSLIALSTAVAAAGAYMRLYDLSTANALTSMGLGAASILLRISSSVASMPYEESYYWPQGISFGTACSFDIVLNATSTTTGIAGWVTAQYSS